MVIRAKTRKRYYSKDFLCLPKLLGLGLLLGFITNLVQKIQTFYLVMFPKVLELVTGYMPFHKLSQTELSHLRSTVYYHRANVLTSTGAPSALSPLSSRPPTLESTYKSALASISFPHEPEFSRKSIFLYLRERECIPILLPLRGIFCRPPSHCPLGTPTQSITGACNAQTNLVGKKHKEKHN